MSNRITADELANIVKLLAAQGPLPMLTHSDWDRIITALREMEGRALGPLEPGLEANPFSKDFVPPSRRCQCPIEDWRDLPSGPACLVCGGAING